MYAPPEVPMIASPSAASSSGKKGGATHPPSQSITSSSIVAPVSQSGGIKLVCRCGLSEEHQRDDGCDPESMTILMCVEDCGCLAQVHCNTCFGDFCPRHDREAHTLKMHQAHQRVPISQQIQITNSNHKFESEIDWLVRSIMNSNAETMTLGEPQVCDIDQSIATLNFTPLDLYTATARSLSTGEILPVTINIRRTGEIGLIGSARYWKYPPKQSQFITWNNNNNITPGGSSLSNRVISLDQQQQFEDRYLPYMQQLLNQPHQTNTTNWHPEAGIWQLYSNSSIELTVTNDDIFHTQIIIPHAHISSDDVWQLDSTNQVTYQIKSNKGRNLILEHTSLDRDSVSIITDYLPDLLHDAFAPEPLLTFLAQQRSTGLFRHCLLIPTDFSLIMWNHELGETLLDAMTESSIQYLLSHFRLQQFDSILGELHDLSRDRFKVEFLNNYFESRVEPCHNVLELSDLTSFELIIGRCTISIQSSTDPTSYTMIKFETLRSSSPMTIQLPNNESIVVSCPSHWRGGALSSGLFVRFLIDPVSHQLQLETSVDSFKSYWTGKLSPGFN